MKTIVGKTLFFITILMLIDVSAVHAAPAAYIDPNTGGMLFQILAVAFTLLSGVIFFFSSRIKMTFARMARYVREKTGKQSPQESSPQSPETL